MQKKKYLIILLVLVCGLLFVNNVFAESTGGSVTTSFPNPITSNSIADVLNGLMKALYGLVVTLAIIFIVIGGILYMMSAGDPGMITRAKNCWLFSVIGLAIVIAAPTFLKQVESILGGSLTDENGQLKNALTIGQIATNILNFLLSVTGIIAIISLVIAGVMYMTAYGDSTRIETAKKTGTWALVGIIVALVSLIAVQQIAKLITG
ncbi:MAG: pilin [Parcubacteria group bacterium]|jgi:type IV secretory pathway VirB2 component (pilin)